MKVYFFILTCLLTLTAGAQNDSMFFEFPVYFEDAIGNKDTVYIGLSEYATPEFVPALGQVNLLNEPFDSVFEVRAAIFDETAAIMFTDLTYLGKRYVLPIRFTDNDPATCNGIRLHDDVSFIVHSLHPPLTIRWDSEPFREGGELRCLGGSWINNTHAPLTLFGWLNLHIFDDAYSWGCMADWNNEVTITPYNLFPNPPDTFPRGYFNSFQDFTTSIQVEGSEPGTDTLVVYNLWWDSVRGDLCRGLVSTDEANAALVPILVYPNPAKDRLTITYNHTDVLKMIQIYSATGKLLKIIDAPTEGVDVNDLTKGIYLLRAFFEDGKIGAQKFVKGS